MAALTPDQKSAISNDPRFLDRIEQALRDKALYWKESATATRASVNKQIQKRKRLSKNIFTIQQWTEGYKQLVGNYWLTSYTNNPAVVDANGIPTSTEIGNTFDPTYDYWAGVQAGDDIDQEIEW